MLNEVDITVAPDTVEEARGATRGRRGATVDRDWTNGNVFRNVPFYRFHYATPATLGIWTLGTWWQCEGHLNRA